MTRLFSGILFICASVVSFTLAQIPEYYRQMQRTTKILGYINEDVDNIQSFKYHR